MENLLLIDTSVSSLNKGDDIIMECVRKELGFIFDNNFELTLPSHVSAFNWFQIFRDSNRVRKYRDCRLKFVGGTNLLVKNMLTHYPQWNINIFNYKAIQGCVLVGVGAGAGEERNRYTTSLYRKILNHDYYHSVRDERTKIYVESLGLKAINTGCVTMWALTPDFCKTIPTRKAGNVIFTLTARGDKDPRDQQLIDILRDNYNSVSFWVQGDGDYKYLNQFDNIEGIKIIPPTKDDYHKALCHDNVEYVGTRLHAGVYAMRHSKRAIIIVIDERAREINKSNNLVCLEKDNISTLPNLINSEFDTNIQMPLDEIERWKKQFIINR